ncbi:MAG: hypothetical protein H6R41_782 [Deltaproteobacteria bacterium]|nr:hypothetical protein [Deltaproteobacteria bacterium]MBS1244245.1 hypothetical protein [Deltaproteobacteria bacterium]
MSRVKEAEEEFREATRLSPSYTRAHYNLGLCLLRREDREGASRQLEVLSFLDLSLAQRYAGLRRSRGTTGGDRPPARPSRGSRRTYPPM